MQSWFSNVRADIAGGLVSALVAIPLAMGFGMFAFVSLGESYFADGALAGLYTAFILGIVCVLLGDRTTTVYAPRVNSTFFLGLLAYGLVHSDNAAIAAGGPTLVLAIVFSVIVLGGLIQALFGLVRLGTLIKFVPHPVMAGFQNAAALLLFLVQLANVCGLERHISFMQMPHHLLEARPISLVVAAITFAVMWNAKKILPKIPPLLVGIAAGTLLYYALQFAGLGDRMGPVIGSYPAANMLPFGFSYFDDLWNSGHLFDYIHIILSAALALAIIASIDAMLCAKLVTPAGEKAVESNRLLLRLGAGNMASGLFGGITSGLNIGASLANRNFGARTPLAVLVNAAAMIAACVSFWHFGAYLPQVALSACIMVIAIQHLDGWSLKLVPQVLSRTDAYRRTATLDLLVVVAVAVLSIALNIVAAVFIGIAIAVLLFMYRTSRGIVRRSYRCDNIQSRKSRGTNERNILDEQGGQILAMELQGALFFGSGETLAQAIDTAAQTGAKSVILDLRRITEIDTTGANVLVEIGGHLARGGKNLLLAVAGNSKQAKRLNDFGVTSAVTPEKIFPDVDRAIEWAEDDLLRAASVSAVPGAEIPPEQISLFSDFSAAEISAIRPKLERKACAKDEVVFHEGDPGDGVYTIAKGTASVFIKQPEGGNIRLATFATSTVFGELALLDEGPRSASVIANEDLVCWFLSKTNFAALSREAPPVAIKLIRGLGRELSGRLRTANRTIHQLES